MRRNGAGAGTRASAAVLGALLVATALAGCASASAAPPPASASTRPTATVGPLPTATTSPSSSAATRTVLAVNCKTLLPKAVLAALGKGFVRQKGFTPVAGDEAATLIAQGGTACGWQSPVTGDTLVVAIAEPSASTATGVKDDLVERSHSVPTYGAEGYFQAVEGFGIADAFPGPYWISAKSDAFFEPGDATGVVQAVEKALAKA